MSPGSPASKIKFDWAGISGSEAIAVAIIDAKPIKETAREKIRFAPASHRPVRWLKQSGYPATPLALPGLAVNFIRSLACAWEPRQNRCRCRVIIDRPRRWGFLQAVESRAWCQFDTP